ncbi:MAG: hypothetical protein AAF517_20890 [Planctomycetota bacterium]
MGLALGMAARELGRGLLDLMAPLACLRCGELLFDRWEPFCPSCVETVRWIDGACRSCATPILNSRHPADSSNSRPIVERCGACVRRLRFHRTAVVAGRYEGLLRDLVIAHKFEREQAASRYLAQVLWGLWERELEADPGLGDSPWVVTAVPQHWTRTLYRGSEPAEHLAREFCRLSGFPFRVLLTKTRATCAQVELSRSARLTNLRGAFRRRWDFWRSQPSHVILIDDVVTTLSTASECSRALKRSGTPAVWVLAVARS